MNVCYTLLSIVYTYIRRPSIKLVGDRASEECGICETINEIGHLLKDFRRFRRSFIMSSATVDHIALLLTSNFLFRH